MADLDLFAAADEQKLLALVVDYYHRTLTSSQEALAYLQRRGLTDGRAITQFRIGYADRTLGLKLPKKILKAGRELRGRLERLGLYRATGREHFNGCVVFPITAADGSRRIVDVYGRKTLGKKLQKRCPLDLHLNDKRAGVWNIEAFGATEEIILCPALFDALSFWTHGYRHVTCTFSPDTLTDDHLSAFREFKIQRALTPCPELVPQLLAAGLDCYLLKLPSGLSVNEYALQVADPADALGMLLRKAEWVANGDAALRGAQERESARAPDGEPEVSATGASEPEALATGANDDNEPEDDDLDDDEVEETPAAAEPAIAEPVTPDSSLLTLHASRSTLHASPLPPAPQDIDAETKGDEVTVNLGHRRYRVRGLGKNLAFDQLRVNVLASTERGTFVDTFDLYSARHRKAFITETARELGVEENTVKKDLGRVLLKLEELQDQQMAAALTPKEPQPTMSVEEKDDALQLLRDPQLLDRLQADFQLVGENTNKLIGYLAAVSRKLDQPLAVIIQSSSAAGKTALMDAILSFVPPEDQVKFSAMTGQALFYMGETDLKHKILAIVEEEGAERAGFALKLLQSEGELRIASTGKDSGTGRLVTQEYRVEGPVMLFLTTTAITIDEELLNRCLVLTVDEEREQTRAIHQAQRRQQTLPGLLAAQERQRLLTLHRNAQRLLRPLLVANPYAESLTFLDDKVRTRRDHVKYLSLIRAVTLLHQYQRPVRTVEHQGRPVEYVEVAPDDIAVANRLANEVLGRAVDDLPPQTRRLLALIDKMVTTACQEKGLDRTDYRFSRREVREYAGWGHTQLKVHLKRLEELEYLLVHRGGRGQAFVYELLYESNGGNGHRFLARLLDANKLSKDDEVRGGASQAVLRSHAERGNEGEGAEPGNEDVTTTPTGRGKRAGGRGQKADWSGGGRGQVGPKSGGCRGDENDANPGNHTAKCTSGPKTPKT